jgi:hypothetical protein
VVDKGARGVEGQSNQAPDATIRVARDTCVRIIDTYDMIISGTTSPAYLAQRYEFVLPSDWNTMFELSTS